jgi:hypothetical protein
VITKEEAAKRARAQIEERLQPDEYALLDDSTRDEDFGWVFFYKSTGDSSFAGNAPIAVRRESGEVRVTGTALPVEDYIRELRREWNSPDTG